MSPLKGVSVQVVGAGVVGLCVALELQNRGAEVALLDEGGPPNASAVAAGMIAPAFEAVLDDAARGRFPLYRAARDAWLDFADGRVVLKREGAMAASASDSELAGILDSAEREGIPCEILSPDAARKLRPELTAGLAGAVFTPEDWRVEAEATLRLLEAAFAAGGGRRRLVRFDAAAVRDGGDVLVVCAGWGSRGLAAMVPELGRLQPVKGQLIRFSGAEPRDGPTVRHGAGGYLVPSRGGVVAGASMEPGRDDRHPSQEVQAAVRRDAVRLMPQLVDLPSTGAVGVRAATPDGLPLVGRSRSGVHLATGFRRNGWLMAPLAARIVAEQLSGGSPGPWAGALRPGRFEAPD